MSSRQYTVTVKLDDKGVLSKLNQLGSGSPIGGGGGKGALSAAGGSGGGGGIFGKLESLGVGQLLKLTGIGIGIGSLVTATVKSSVQLQGIFKLWETGMMLVFKPFGDFIATLLRPLTIMMLQWAVPFYRDASKFFKEWLKSATKISDEQIGQAKDAAGTVGGWEVTATGAIMLFFSELQDSAKATFTKQASDITTALEGTPDAIAKVFTDFGDSLVTALTDMPAFLANKFLDLGTDIGLYLTNIPGFLAGLFLNLGADIWNGLLSVPSTLADVFTGLASSISSTLAGVPSAIYNAIMGWINSLGGAFGGGGGGGGADLSSRFGGSTTRTRATMAGMADAVGI